MLAGAAKSSKNSLKDNGHDSHGKVSYAEVQPDTTNPVALQENRGANGAPAKSRCQQRSHWRVMMGQT